jgi:YopX protein
LDVTEKEIYSGDIVRDKALEKYEVLNDGSVCILDNHQEEPEDRYKTFDEVGMEVTIIGTMYDNSDLLS